MINMSGITILRQIKVLKAQGLGWENICVMLKLTTPREEKFVRDLVIKQPAKKVA